jgi:hypothetical protein
MEIKYCPTDCEGHVVINLLSQSQKLEAMKSIGLTTNAQGEVETVSSNLDQGIMMIGLVEKNIKEVSIKKGDIEFKSFEDLNYGDMGLCLPIISDIANRILKGKVLGESSGLQLLKQPSTP